MSRFSIRNPYFIIVICLALMVIGVTSLARMPVDLFPSINIPEVVVATFYSGMPPEDIETDITNPLERFFTMASGMDHMESRSMLGVSIIKAFFQPGTNADADVTELSNLALADLKRLPPGTLPPVVLKFDASSLPVCLVTLKGQGLTETQLHDIGQFTIRNQIAVVQGATIPPPFGGKYRQVMIYVDPYKLQSRQLSPMDVVDAVNRSNLILPAGDVKMGPYDYYVYSNSLVKKVEELNDVPIRTIGQRWVSVGDIGEAKDANQIQYNIVRVDGQRSAYLPIMKQGGDTNTIQVVNGIRDMIGRLFDIPKQLQATVVFDQSAFVKEAINTLLHEGLIGLALTSLMILIFLGSLRATVAVFLSIPLSALSTFVVLYLLGSTVNTMILGGLALAFSRVIDNSVIALENIYRHLEMGASPEVAAEQGGAEVSLAVLAATLTTVVVFFPVTFLYGVSKFLFSALALAVVISLFASYFVAMTVIPLFCARFLKSVHHAQDEVRSGGFNAWFNRGFHALLDFYERMVRGALRYPVITIVVLLGLFAGSLAIFPQLGVAFFPRTDAGQFTIDLKVPTGARIESTDEYVAKIEDLVRHVVDPADFNMIVSNIGIVPDFSALYTTNAGPYTATIQVELKDSHKTGSFEYIDRMRREISSRYPELRTFFSSGSMVDAILNMGMPAPIDVQVSSRDLDRTYNIAQDLSARIRKLPDIGEVYVPQDMNYPAVRLKIDRVHAAEMGLSQKEIVDNVITALNSNTMIAPNYWVDHQTGNDYFLTVQYYERGKPAIHNFVDLQQIPLRGTPQNGQIDGVRPDGMARSDARATTVLGNVASLDFVQSPTEIDHYQIQRVADVYVTPSGEDLGKVTTRIQQLLDEQKYPSNIRINLRGMVQGMNDSFRSFAIGLSLSVLLLFLILVAQFRSFIDPFLIMLAIPMGFIGVLIVLPLTHTTLNVMSLMGVLMLVGIAASNSILIVEFAHRLEEQGRSVEDAVIMSCRVRLRPILMTSFATIIGMVPMALKLGTGSEQYAPLARAIIGGLTVSVLLTVFIVPAAYLLVYGRRQQPAEAR
ncbi:MAG TPA: efflux RND transporter permease subunit [Bryobacteraceae bacterium]|nr:efflux RND transporter permease subunit [Bryobacteraceae bacterium]